MNKLNFLRPRKMRILDKRASNDRNGFRANTDGTTVKSRKPNIDLKPNHRQHISRPIRSWVSLHAVQAISDGEGWYVHQ